MLSSAKFHLKEGRIVINVEVMKFPKDNISILRREFLFLAIVIQCT